MLSKQEIFELYDKEKKGFLTKHQLKLALIYILGYKLRYDEIKKIWNGRLEFENYKFDKNLVLKGIIFEYFAYIYDLLLKNMRNEKKAQIEFRSIDNQNKGFLNYEDFKNLIELQKTHFLNEATKREIFQALDSNQDGKISVSDYSESLFLYKNN